MVQRIATNIYAAMLSITAQPAGEQQAKIVPRIAFLRLGSGLIFAIQ